MIDILDNNKKLIGKRICRKNKFSNKNNWDEILEEYRKKWVQIYHGTKFVFIGNIMLMGLLRINKPLEGHIPFRIKVNKIIYGQMQFLVLQVYFIHLNILKLYIQIMKNGIL